MIDSWETFDNFAVIVVKGAIDILERRNAFVHELLEVKLVLQDVVETFRPHSLC